MDKSKFVKKEGNNSGDIYLFALSTCIWCKRTKEFLDEKGVEYNFVFVDQLDPVAKREMREHLKKWNPNMSYPTIVFNNATCVVGFDEEQITKELSL